MRSGLPGTVDDSGASNLTLETAFALLGELVAVLVTSSYGQASGRVLAAGRLDGLLGEDDGIRLQFEGGFTLQVPHARHTWTAGILKITLQPEHASCTFCSCEERLLIAGRYDVACPSCPHIMAAHKVAGR